MFISTLSSEGDYRLYFYKMFYIPDFEYLNVLWHDFHTALKSYLKRCGRFQSYTQPWFPFLWDNEGGGGGARTITEESVPSYFTNWTHPILKIKTTSNKSDLLTDDGLTSAANRWQYTTAGCQQEGSMWYGYVREAQNIAQKWKSEALSFRTAVAASGLCGHKLHPSLDEDKLVELLLHENSSPFQAIFAQNIIHA